MKSMSSLWKDSSVKEISSRKLKNIGNLGTKVSPPKSKFKQSWREKIKQKQRKKQLLNIISPTAAMIDPEA